MPSFAICFVPHCRGLSPVPSHKYCNAFFFLRYCPPRNFSNFTPNYFTMKYKLGNQYPFDDNFKAKARKHQSLFRAEILQIDFNEYGNRLTEKDASNFLNFYPELGVIETLKERYPKYSKGLYADMLRSEHIPFNLFAPLKKDLNLAQRAFNQLLDNIEIKTITNIEIEYAPKPASQFLDDRTSFDAFVEFLTATDEKGFLGIEVKYTEHEYKLKPKSTEDANINSPSSIYNTLSKNQNLFITSALPLLKSDKLRQIWRNHLLGESMLIHPSFNFKHFISVILYPEGNNHFVEVIPEYQSLLLPNLKHKLQGITFESYFDALTKSNSDDAFRKWIKYLQSRYIIHP